jgi:hypothetical protein
MGYQASQVRVMTLERRFQSSPTGCFQTSHLSADLLQILPKLGLPVPPAQLDLESDKPGHVRREAREALLAAAADADEERVAAGQTEDAGDAGGVLHGVAEKDWVVLFGGRAGVVDGDLGVGLWQACRFPYSTGLSCMHATAHAPRLIVPPPLVLKSSR